MNIGNKLKSMRLANRLTLEELANRSELSKGFLSQVERDLTSPSIDTLDDILEALGSNLHDFFAPDVDEQLVFGKDDFFINEQDDYVITYIVPNAQKNDMEPILIELDRNKKSMTMPPFEGEVFGYVMSGKILLHFGNRDETVRTGETFYLKANRTHYIENRWDRKARVIWVTTPPQF